ncbi:MAG: hypothetical protein N4A72_21475 [Bacteroidales bacterium]|jgi:hypothetical protein|nr:hypothetical protein [Bacteroidales bacterium]
MIKNIIVIVSLLALSNIVLAQRTVKDTIDLSRVKNQTVISEIRYDINSPAKINNEQAKYDLKSSSIAKVNITLPVWVSHKTFKLTSKIAYISNSYDIDNYEPKSPDVVDKSFKLDDRYFRSQKMALSLTGIKIFKIKDRSLVLMQTVSASGFFEPSVFRFSSSTFFMYPLKSKSSSVSKQIGIIVMVNESGRVFPIPMFGYTKIWQPHWVFRTRFPYNASFMRIVNNNFDVSLNARLLTELPLVESINESIVDRKIYGLSNVKIMELGLKFGLSADYRLYKNIWISAEGGLRSVFLSQFKDQDDKVLLKNDPYSNAYLGFNLSYRISRVNKKR